MAVEYVAVDPDLEGLGMRLRGACHRLQCAMEVLRNEDAEAVVAEVAGYLDALIGEFQQATAWPPVGLKPAISKRLRHHCFAGIETTDEPETQLRMRYYASAAVERALNAGLTHQEAQIECLRTTEATEEESGGRTAQMNRELASLMAGADVPWVLVPIYGPLFRELLDYCKEHAGGAFAGEAAAWLAQAVVNATVRAEVKSLKAQSVSLALCVSDYRKMAGAAADEPAGIVTPAQKAARSAGQGRTGTEAKASNRTAKRSKTAARRQSAAGGRRA